MSKINEEDQKDLVVWVDLETTGLNPVEDFVLEIGMRLTDWDGSTEYGRFTSLVHNPGWFERLSLGENRPAFEIHQANGLTAELKEAEEQTTHTGIATLTDVRETESLVMGWLNEYGVPHGLSLAGSSNHLDRYFMRWHMPEVYNHFGYRLLDVSAIRESMRVANPELNDLYDTWRKERVDVHRVQPDIDASIAQWQWFIDNYLHV